MPTFTLRLTGNATISMLAEQASLRVASCSQGPNKQSVIDEVLTTASYIEDMIRKVQAQDASEQSVAHWSRTTLSIDDWVGQVPLQLAQGQGIVGEVPDEEESRSSIFGNRPLGVNSRGSTMVSVRRYRGRIEFDVRFRNFTIMGEFSTHLTTIDRCQVMGPTWQLDPENEERHRSQLRARAAKDARTKAVDYCQVVCPGEKGLVIVPCELGSENFAGGLFAAMDRQINSVFNAAPAIVAKEPIQSCRPQETKMSLSVDVVFTVETSGYKLSTMVDI